MLKRNMQQLLKEEGSLVGSPPIERAVTPSTRHACMSLFRLSDLGLEGKTVQQNEFLTLHYVAVWS